MTHRRNTYRHRSVVRLEIRCSRSEVSSLQSVGSTEQASKMRTPDRSAGAKKPSGNSLTFAWHKLSNSSVRFDMIQSRGTTSLDAMTMRTYRGGPLSCDYIMIRGAHSSVSRTQETRLRPPWSGEPSARDGEGGRDSKGHDGARQTSHLECAPIIPLGYEAMIF